MKTVFRNLTLGALLAGCAVVTAPNAFAQDVCTTDIEGNQALYKQFTDNFDKKEVEKKEIAVTAGKQYTEKYGACADYKAQVDYIKGQVPVLEKDVARIKGATADKAVIDRFNTSAKAKNVSEIFPSGKELYAKKPDLIDIPITLAAAGFEQTLATPTVNTYNDDTIAQAKEAIRQLEAGKKTTGYGVYTYSFVNPKYPDSKANTLGAMNYMIGYIMYYRQDKKKDALPYFYKAAQYNSFSKTDPTIYQAVGAWYLDEAIKIDKDRQAKLAAATSKTDTPETLAMVASQKGYADRAIDAYSRAYKMAKEDKAQKKEYVDGLYTRLKDIYTFRFDGNTTGIDAFVATVQNKPMPDPSTEVTPVAEEVPATTTPATSSSTAPATVPATTTTKPAATATPVKPAGTATTTKPATTEVKATATTPAKSAPKKKGTR